MVAILSPGKSIRNSFYYNENKVKNGVAKLLHAENYPIPMDQLTEKMRIGMLQKMAGLNPGLEVNSMHITLNFDPSEQLTTVKFIEIAGSYMEKIGFGNQPYLIYQHFDAGHPHLHLVTTNVEASGKGINLNRLGIRKSEPARKEIEISYGLVRAEDQPKADNTLKSAYNTAIAYGKTESKRSIGNVLSALLGTYHYSSLTELNALLGQYNVSAERGSEDSRMYKKNGLVYRILGEHKRPVGVPLKASCFYNKPTLKFLEGRFSEGAKEKAKIKIRLRNTIDLTIRKPDVDSLEKLQEALLQQGVHTVLRDNKDGVIYGITYVDHRNKCVFNGSELGKNYSAKGILEQFAPLTKANVSIAGSQANPQDIKSLEEAQNIAAAGFHSLNSGHVNDSDPDLLALLMASEYAPDYLPYQLSGKKKKRKKRKRTDNN